ncbi:abc transporter [Moniliophthora roreri]|nr:abc transporter [Moniliophthora roreri]
MFNVFHPPPAPPEYGKGKVLPEENASFLSRLIFHWISPFLSVGFSRPLEKDDLWELPPHRLTVHITDSLEGNFFSRCPPEARPLVVRDKFKTAEQTLKAEVNEKELDIESNSATPEPKPRSKKDKKYDSSLAKAIFVTFRGSIATSGVLKLVSDTLKTTTPLVNKALLTWLEESYFYYRASDELKTTIPKPRGIGYGIGLAIAIFAMQEIASLMSNHFMQITMANGLAVRTGLIGNIFRKSLRLSGRARTEHSVGKITTMISTDATRLDRFSSFGHNLWIAPIQIAIGVGLLIGNVTRPWLASGYVLFTSFIAAGPNAKSEKVLILGFPLQAVLVRVMFSQRKKGVKITDSRVLQGVRLIKAYAWEGFYTSQLGNIRQKEVNTLRKMAVARSLLIALVVFIPTVASVLSFITYALTNHDLNVAIIFSSLQLIIRMPLIFVPIILAALSDALVAMKRIGSFLTAEELDEPYLIDRERKFAVEADGDFTWEKAGKLEENKFQKAGPSRDGDRKSKKTKESLTKGSSKESPPQGEKNSAIAEAEKPFELLNLKLNIPKGSFMAIVGRVGSGKALVGEMRRTRGHVTFGGTVAYVPQIPWIRNATLKENVWFGLPEDEARENTEIGEKGINLSGTARVSLARAAYSSSDVVLLDDPLSAVDSYVGKAILRNCILNGPLAGRTRILVTHALHVLDKTDHILVVDNGKIVEQGTYEALTRESVLFSRLIEEYGKSEEEKDTDTIDSHSTLQDAKQIDAAPSKKASGSPLMQDEERNTGAVTWSMYGRYLKYAGGIVWVPVIVLLHTIAQAAQVGNNLFLGYWTATSIPGFSQAQYMGVYAGLGLFAGFNMFNAALSAVLKSPVSFFDTTPIGRILSRLSKDQDTIDTELMMNLSQFLSTFSSVLGTVALVFYVLPYLGIIFVPMTIFYYVCSLYYRRTSVETKRLDSLLRSALYSSYSETLTGLATIRAYGEQDRAITDAEQLLDQENKAYYMTISIQRWLAIRLDVLGNILVFGIALFAAGFRTSISPAKIGVVLSYTLSITAFFSEMVAQFAQQEQSMNAVERLLVYAELPAEGNTKTSEDPPPSWPEKGEIQFSKVKMAYRPGLPLVLKDIGVVGRTGAGKSSLLQALLRMVEIQDGKIEIDGFDSHHISLETLRGRLALVPQDGTLFLGTLRENLDPLGLRTDAELISALQRSWLLPREGPVDPAVEAKFSLDSAVGDEGSNFSAGEKQLLALCRALVKNSRIIILDEATSNVDVETDSKIQRTIQTEFATSTLICIAHRLNTIGK